MSLNEVLFRSGVSGPDREWLRCLVNEWHLLSDMSFSDLILWVPGVDENVFWAAAQIRPSTGPTALEDDVVGEDISYDPEHLVTEAYLSQQICETSEHSIFAGIPVDVWAIPVMRSGRCIAVVERHASQMGIRTKGALEDNYLEIADVLTTMLWRGQYPVTPSSDPTQSPRVGDGIIRLDSDSLVVYASPNAQSAYRRMGHVGELEDAEFKTLTQRLSPGLKEVGQNIGTDLSGRIASEIDIESDKASMRLRIVPLGQISKSASTLVLCRDTTELRNLDRQLVTKDATIREIHHRVKNNLQTVAALLRMQSRRIHSTEGKNALRDAMRRVASIAVVHEILSQAFDEEVAFDDVCDRILRMVGDVAAAAGKVTAKRRGSFGLISANSATSLSLVITELCQNAIEHGLANRSGTVEVIPSRDGGYLQVDVLDDGVGLPADFSVETASSLGLSIVRTLASDLAGEIEFSKRNDTSGTRARLRVPRHCSRTLH
ncbi:MAG: hypothetical protein CR979_00660 [Propionibacterium sp.]|nr:MAG: hypothetical protein CR979_00660 [Propionibacterium sp.]